MGAETLAWLKLAAQTADNTWFRCVCNGENLEMCAKINQNVLLEEDGGSLYNPAQNQKSLELTTGKLE